MDNKVTRKMISSFHGAIEVIFYGYRKGSVNNAFVRYDEPSYGTASYEEHRENYEKLMNYLVERSNGHMDKDNHICFEVIFKDGEKCGIQMSDGNVWIGTSVKH